MIKTIFLCVFALTFPEILQAALINFDSPFYPGVSERTETYLEDGVKFSGAFAHTDTGFLDNPDNGSAFIQYRDYSSVNFGMANNSLFDLVSIDLAELDFDKAIPTTVTFMAQRPGSVMVSTSFTTDGLLGAGSDFETFFFGDAFRGVEYVYIADGSDLFSFDNINITTVPLPAASWLFLSGLMGVFGCFHRKKFNSI
jgi:hypothetical protein